MSGLPEPYYDRDGITIYVGDNRDVLPHIGPVHAVCTDPPYGLAFMGKAWDKGVPGVEFWQAIMAAMLPGAHLLAFGGSRTYHRMAVAIEDAGYEIRDTLQWLYGSGMPKSHNIAVAIDKQAGAIGHRGARFTTAGIVPGQKFEGKAESGRAYTDPKTPEAKQWDGWGTALKPAYEPIIMARKPFKGNVAANVLAHGTGALNIDQSRIPAQGRPLIESKSEASLNAFGDGLNGSRHAGTTDQGRWPPNVILDEAAAAMLDAQSGVTTSRAGNPNRRSKADGTNTYFGAKSVGAEHNDTGGASRFFKVVAQDCLSTYNVEEQECAPCGEESTEAGNTFAGKNTESSEGNSHTAGCGSKPTGLFQTDTKSTTSTTTHSITSCPTCNSSPQNGTTTTTSGCGKITETLTALNTDAANGVTSTSHSPSSSGGRQEPTTDTASLASLTTSESGEPQTANTTTPTCASTASAITGSRFFYVAKASRRERNAGLEGMPERINGRNQSQFDGGAMLTGSGNPRSAGMANHHPTVKPLALMRYLIQMVTPPDGIVLDPFMGSGSTLVAAAELGFRAIGIELSEEYAEIAARRVDHALNERARRLPGLETAL
jgi:hypothetical protein